MIVIQPAFRFLAAAALLLNIKVIGLLTDANAHRVRVATAGSHPRGLVVEA